MPGRAQDRDARVSGGHDGNGVSSAACAVVYCLIPRDLAPRLHELLRRHFAGDAGVEMVVERRGAERRREDDRRVVACEPRVERRRIRSVVGRRVGERRTVQVPVWPPELPRRARAHQERLVFVELVEPSGTTREDEDTARLVTRIQTGDREAFALLYMRYFDRVYGYLRLVLRDAHEAEDASQHVFLKLLEALPRYEARGKPFRAWLFTIARNRAVSQLRLAGRSEVADLSELESNESAHLASDDLSVLDWISDRELHLFIDRLPLAQRQVLFLRYFAGMSMAEIATALGETGETVRKRHARALRFLRARLTAVGRAPRQTRRAGSRVLVRPAYVVRVRRFSLLKPLS
jgi:RNA polymerase sigma-70 factor (ECF subfamily)